MSRTSQQREAERARKQRWFEAHREQTRESQARWRARNKTKIAQDTKNRLAKYREWLDALKAAPCTDCNTSFPPECMDWDHLGDKSFGVGEAVKRSRTRVLEEIAKCELVCANCHRTRTKQRRENNG